MTTLHLHSDESRAEGLGTERGLPATWNGTWKGVCRLARAKGPGQSFEMELRITVLPEQQARAWRMVYRDGDRCQVRDYILRPSADDPQRFVLDQQNEILVEHQLIGSVLHSQFEVAGCLLSSRFELDNRGLHVEMVCYVTSADADRCAADGTAESVRSLPVRSVQRGLLTRS